MFQVILELDEELAVVTIDEVALLLKRWRPERRLIGPVTLPLALTPRIAQPEQLDQFALALDLMNRDERVGMTRDHSFIIAVLTLTSACCHHGELALVSLLKHREESIRVFRL